MSATFSYSSPSQFADLRAFCLVAELGSISAAARQMEETKGSVSRRLTRLESDLGVALLIRGARPVLPTEAGRRYRTFAQHTLEILSRGASALQQGEQPSGPLRLACSTGVALTLVSRCILLFRQQYPALQLELLLTDDAPNFGAQRLDMAIYPARKLPDSSLLARKLFDWEMQIVASPSYLEPNRQRMRPEDLAGLNVVFGAGPARINPRTIRIMMPRSNTPKVISLPNAVMTTSTVFAKAVALAGNGIGVVPDFMVKEELQSGQLVEVLPEATVSPKPGGLYLLYAQSRHLPPAIRALHDFLILELGR